MEIINLLLGIIPENILLFLFIKNLKTFKNKENMILFLIFNMFIYVALISVFDYNVLLNLILMMTNYITIRLFCEDGVNSDVFVSSWFWGVLLITNIVVIPLIFINYYFALGINFIIVMLLNKKFANIHKKFYNLIRDNWNIGKNNKMKSLTTRNVVVLIFNLLLIIIGFGFSIFR